MIIICTRIYTLLRNTKTRRTFAYRLTINKKFYSFCFLTAGLSLHMFLHLSFKSIVVRVLSNTWRPKSKIFFHGILLLSSQENLSIPS
ncbi:hypothetical protein HanIR_Chr04g0175801 [Helianthus annuus]|nr:hypothetical protein HanIR_Chr04g0175801 [Helianthus annuus]